jgi:hypothetical protein
LYLDDNKAFIARCPVGRGRKGELKNEGGSHDVIENKGRVNRQIGGSHDVDENKQLIFLGHDVYEK